MTVRLTKFNAEFFDDGMSMELWRHVFFEF